MAEAFHKMDITLTGGLNTSVQADELLLRSHEQVEGGFAQKLPVESPSMKNIDFDSRGLAKRRGSKKSGLLTAAAVPSETLIKAIEWQVPDSEASGGKIQVHVGSLSIYVTGEDEDGTSASHWTQVNDAEGNPYLHNATVTKVTLTSTDAHLFIGLDAGNPAQVYRGGADLDDQFHNYVSTATVQGGGASSGQANVTVSDVSGFADGDRIRLD